MEKSIKNKLKKTAAVFLAAALIFICLPLSSFASGSYYTSVSSMTLTQGASSSFTFGATNAVGAFEISTDGGVSASYSGEKWVDNSSVTISVTGNTVGTGHVYISVYDGADYDGNDLSGKSYTVTVTVKASTTTQTTTTAATTTTTAATTTTQETTEDPELELLSVTVDDTQMYVVKDISDEDLPDGFEIQEVVYNTVTVQVMVFEDVVLYILENESGQTGYYTYDEETGEFEALKYTTLSGKFCIFLDIPETLEIPYGYSVVETEICGFTVEALAVEADEEETEAESETESNTEAESESEAEAEIKAFFTVGETSESADADEEEVIEEEDTETGEDDTEAEETSDGTEDITSIDQMVASSDGHYYVYCLLGEEKVLCDYDSEDDILQRCAAIASVEEETAVQVQAVAEDTEEEDIDINLILLIDVIIACVIIVILAVVLIIVLVVKKKNKVDPEFVDDIDFEEEDIFFGEETDQGADGSGFDTDEFFKEHIEGDINIEEGDAEEEPLAEGPGEVEPEDDEPEAGALEADGQETAQAEDKEPEEGAEEETGASEEKDAGPAPEEGPEKDFNIEDITEILSEEFDKMLKEEGEL